MVDDQSVLKLERLRDDLIQLRADLRKRYPGRAAQARQVTADEIRQQAAKLAETWLVDIASRRDVVAAMSTDYVADLNIRFTRLLTLSQQAAKRSSYESEINAIVKEFTIRLVIPLKRLSKEGVLREPPRPSAKEAFKPTAFLGHSFAQADVAVVRFVADLLQSIGIAVVTAQKPRAARISDKVKRLIDDQHVFVGLFTRRERIAGRSAWTTSPWVIDEKAYAVAKGKVLVLLTESGVDSIGGLQGDYEYITFSRKQLHRLALAVLALYKISSRQMA